ncbi:hypothetical protein, partial [Actinomadura sp. CNU-125]|uniref:hypothetical protein n=1 Tax=Actinomadura sp. CNU-125 TaxID=1904961 RepID=UPI0021CCC5DF
PGAALPVAAAVSRADAPPTRPGEPPRRRPRRGALVGAGALACALTAGAVYWLVGGTGGGEPVTAAEGRLLRAGPTSRRSTAT